MSVQPTARGTFGGTPLSSLLIYALDRKLGGTLVIEDPARRKCGILFQMGAPRKVKVSEPVARLSDLLVERKALTEEQAQATFEASRVERKLHGARLVEGGGLDRSTVEEALVEQMARKLEWIGLLEPSTAYGYYDGQDFLSSYGGAVAADPLELIWRVVRKQISAASVDAALSRFGAREVRLHPSSKVARFGFDARERGLLDVIRMKPQPVSALLSSGLLSASEVKAVLYVLAATRHLDLGDGARPVGVDSGGMAAVPPPAAAPKPAVPARSSPAASPAPAEARPVPAAPAIQRSAPGEGPAFRGMQATLPPQLASTELEQQGFRAEIQVLSERLDSMDYFELLGVERDASGPIVQAAFFQLAKRWHPDRMSADLSDLKDAAGRVFARMSEAHQVLSNDEKRREYVRRMNETHDPNEQELVQRVLRAATAFQKAEVLLRRGSLDEAEAQSQIAFENDPEQAEYAAFYADIVSQKRERTQQGQYADLVKMVNAARKREPQNLKVRIHRARVLRRSGDADGALREFRAVVEQDPSNVEAAREVRLFEMRRGKKGEEPKRVSAPDASSGGKDIGQLIGKWFKR